MSIEMTCPNGHELKIKDHWAGKTGRCPKCRVKMTVPMPIKVTDSDVLAMIGDYVPTQYTQIGSDVAVKQVSDNDVHALDEYETAMDKATSGLSLLGSSVVAHKKTCRHCGHKANLWFATCEGCGEYFDE
ncbi:hypothetical protein [Stieleria varia]|uniref:Double zinc ribbon n=1 Tax=Stieleria varia TaxID=2528005 RepID=A0A5C6B449_9BACT|nr:hypothetical protein [Stieleria varia]TWU06056.1 hypothetical protein Pla52n_17750 [Stieleria varia]